MNPKSTLDGVAMTSLHDTSEAVAAMRAGAKGFLTQPVDVDALSLNVARAVDRGGLHLETENLPAQTSAQDHNGMQGLIGSSPAMQKIYRIARHVAPSRATVLITGESGTGKGELARAIHAMGPRAERPFVALHCAALRDTLLESEFFGHEKGSFTGADRRRIGRFEQAHGGTLFLDEVGEISASTQVKLLRVLQERAFERVGGNDVVTVDVRLIAATNRDLAAEVQKGTFREDLYYRLNVVPVEMPPLRLRMGDIAMLADHFVRQSSIENHKQIEGFTDKAHSKLLSARWSGNVRELENMIERAVVLSRGPRIDEDDLPFDAVAESVIALRIPGLTMAQLERYAITKTMEATHGSTTKAAEILNISVRTIQYRMNEYGLGRKGA